ncbi:MAG TPA: hypothetical protein PLM14_00240, partial [Candidatus Hydrogenedentes bacterium]|nr:hypothetical protein [Candidatus Hydrogenedentota bacterium]
MSPPVNGYSLLPSGYGLFQANNKRPLARRANCPGALLASFGLGGLVFGLTEGPAGGWTPPVVAITVAGVLLLGLFLLVESRTAEPLLPLGLFADRQFSAANLVT